MEWTLEMKSLTSCLLATRIEVDSSVGVELLRLMSKQIHSGLGTTSTKSAAFCLMQGFLRVARVQGYYTENDAWELLRRCLCMLVC